MPSMLLSVLIAAKLVQAYSTNFTFECSLFSSSTKLIQTNRSERGPLRRGGQLVTTYKCCFVYLARRKKPLMVAIHDWNFHSA